MNENLNLVEILKDCPKGTKLYSTIHGEVELVEIRKNCNTNHPIVYKYKDDNDVCTDSATIDGKFNYFANGECTLFPSKDQRDWSKFKVETEMIDGEIYYCSFVNNVYDSIYIHSKTTMCKTEYYVRLNLFDLTLHRNAIITTIEGNIKELRKATDEEKQQLLNAIKKDGYKWDEETKTLEEIDVPDKFDISTLQPFDKVLVRSSNSTKWRCDLFSFVCFDYYKFSCVSYSYSQCIPYNDETKHLVGSTEIPPKKYVTWEE